MKNKILAIVAALGAVAIVQPYRIYCVDGTSMTPTFKNRQLLVGMVRPRTIQRGDVIVFKHDDDTLIKRVSYLPGDSIDQFRVFGSWLIPQNTKVRRGLERKKVPKETFVVPEKSVYVLADNPFGTIDSRTFGAIPESSVIAVIPGDDQDACNTVLGSRLGGAVALNL